MLGTSSTAFTLRGDSTGSVHRYRKADLRNPDVRLLVPLCQDGLERPKRYRRGDLTTTGLFTMHICPVCTPGW